MHSWGTSLLSVIHVHYCACCIPQCRILNKVHSCSILCSNCKGRGKKTFLKIYFIWWWWRPEGELMLKVTFQVHVLYFTSLPCLNKAVLEPRVSPAFAITYFCNHFNIRFDPITAKTWNQRSLTLDDLWPQVFWGHMCDSTQGSLNQVLWKYIKVCEHSTWPFFKNLNQRSLTPRWPLTPSLLWSYVWLYPRIIVTKSHENSSKYVDTVTLFWKLEPKVIDP